MKNSGRSLPNESILLLGSTLDENNYLSGSMILNKKTSQRNLNKELDREPIMGPEPPHCFLYDGLESMALVEVEQETIKKNKNKNEREQETRRVPRMKGVMDWVDILITTKKPNNQQNNNIKTLSYHRLNNNNSTKQQ